VKVCPTCQLNKPVSDFAKNAVRKDGLQSICRSCSKALNAARYQKTKPQYRLRDDALRARNKQAVRAYLASHPCVDCGDTDPDVLTFDHVRGKKLGNLSDMVKHSWGLTTIFEEIAKCEVRCANCHLKKTRQRLSESAKVRTPLSASLTDLPFPVLHTAATS
jgi:hypothetical protein